MDRLTPEQRSLLMSKIRQKNTGPEMAVRKLVYALGYRYRIHRHDLPGTPDLAFITRKKAIFVHGCFWHRHACTRGQQRPKSNIEYWQEKLERNRLRDRRNVYALRKMGWKVLTIWECQLRDIKRIQRRLERFLDPVCLSEKPRVGS